MCILQIEGKDSPPAKKLPVTELWYLLSCSGLEPNPQHLQGLPVNNLQEDLVQACNCLQLAHILAKEKTLFIAENASILYHLDAW